MSPMEKVGPQMKKGFMGKQGDWFKDEKQRWFVLDRGNLSYFLKEAEEPPYGRDKKGEMTIDETVGIYTLERPPQSGAGDRDSKSSVASLESSSRFSAIRESFKTPSLSASVQRNTVSSRVCKNDKQILIVRIIGGKEDADLFVCQSREERDEWVAALEAHKFSNIL